MKLGKNIFERRAIARKLWVALYREARLNQHIWEAEIGRPGPDVLYVRIPGSIKPPPPGAVSVNSQGVDEPAPWVEREIFISREPPASLHCGRGYVEEGEFEID